MTTPPSDPFETPGDNNESARPPRYGDAPPRQGPTPPPYPEQTPPGQSPPGYQGEQQFGQPTGYPPYGQPPAAPEPPSSILTAVKLMYAGAVLSLLWTIFFSRPDVVRDNLDPESTNIPAEDVDAVVNLAIGSIIVLGLITIGLWILMARANRAGKSWARIVATMLGGLAILSGLLGTLRAEAVPLVLDLVLIALSASILVLLYRRESSEYYDAVSRRSRY